MLKNNIPLFITFEGGEGAGKTTLIAKIEESLLKLGYQVLITREPGSTVLGEKIRHLLLDKSEEFSLAPFSELFLFLAARAQLTFEKIKPALDEKKIVLCDRYSDSSIAYQGQARQLGVEKVTALCQIATENLTPDLTFYLDIDPIMGLKRRKKSGFDRIEEEKIDFHKKVRQAFLKIAEKNKKRIQIINAELSAESVFEQTFKIIYDQLK